MDRYYCYGKTDIGERYDALRIIDSDGDCYDATDVNARIAELEAKCAELGSGRQSLANEIRRTIKENGHFAGGPGHTDADLITWLNKAIATERAAAEVKCAATQEQLRLTHVDWMMELAARAEAEAKCARLSDEYEEAGRIVLRHIQEKRDLESSLATERAALASRTEDLAWAVKNGAWYAPGPETFINCDGTDADLLRAIREARLGSAGEG